jgi:hypothetical protein
MHSYCLPNIVPMVFGSTDGIRARGMSLTKKLFLSLTKARLYIDTHQDGVASGLKDLLKDLWWHTTQLGLECIATAQLSGWDYKDAEVRSQAFCIWSGPSNTKYYCEEPFGHLTHIVARLTKGRHVMSKPSTHLPKEHAYFAQ